MLCLVLILGVHVHCTARCACDAVSTAFGVELVSRSAPVTFIGAQRHPGFVAKSGISNRWRSTIVAKSGICRVEGWRGGP